MKKCTWFGILCAALFLLVFGVKGISADTLKLTGVGGASSGGEYTYPYYISINGGTPQGMMCIDFKDNIGIGQSWSAQAFSAKDLDTTYGTKLFAAAAWLLHFGLQNPGDMQDAQWAVWELFDPGVAAARGTNTAEEIALLTEALGLSNSQLAAFSWYTVWVPTGFDGTNMGSLGGQLFMSDVPEPATLFLLGTGLLGLALLLYFRKQPSRTPSTPAW